MPLSLRDLGQRPGFRPATIDDAEMLFWWRRKDEQGEWFQGNQVTFDQHRTWLQSRLENPLVRVLIWDGNQGCVRIDSNGEVAFHAEHGCDTVAMLRAVQVYAEGYGGRLKASVDQADTVSIALFQEAGFELFPTKFLCYRP